MTSTHMTTLDISVIIPTLNEEGSIARLADQLINNVGEVIIVDGGSSDNTVARAKARRIRTLENTEGRGSQLNQGASASNGEILLFLHADTRLPDGFSTDVINLINSDHCAVGTFRLAVDNPTLALKFIVFMANLRSKFLKLPYGDQCFFMTQEHFDNLGGFPLDEIMEDYIFIRKARKHGNIVTLRKEVTTSARRWERLGICHTTFINFLMIVGYSIGIPTRKLASFYRR